MHIQPISMLNNTMTTDLCECQTCRYREFPAARPETAYHMVQPDFFVWAPSQVENTAEGPSEGSLTFEDHSALYITIQYYAILQLFFFKRDLLQHTGGTFLFYILFELGFE